MKMIGRELLQKMSSSLQMIREIDEEIRHLNLENEQKFLNWQDELNELSVK